MATTASGSGSGQSARNPDTVGPNAAESLFAAPVQSAPVQPPRVTLTIDLGSLTPESIGAIAAFVQAALAASPATAIGRADSKMGIPAAEDGAVPASGSTP